MSTLVSVTTEVTIPTPDGDEQVFDWLNRCADAFDRAHADGQFADVIRALAVAWNEEA